jgi:hypothetical protein
MISFRADKDKKKLTRISINSMGYKGVLFFGDSWFVVCAAVLF